MQVQELFKRLSYAELADLSIGLSGQGAIDPEQQPRVISQLNTALTGIYTRFLHRRAYLEFVAVEGLKTYHLRREFALSNTDPANTNPRYIQDSLEQPMQEDLIKILSIERLDDPETSRMDEGLNLGINARRSSKGVIILSHDSFRIAVPKAGERYLVEYQANHLPITLPVDLSQEISIQPGLEEALQVRVAAGIFESMNGEGHAAKATRLINRYEQLCALQKQDDTAQESGSDEYDRLRSKGFI